MMQITIHVMDENYTQSVPICFYYYRVCTVWYATNTFSIFSFLYPKTQKNTRNMQENTLQNTFCSSLFFFFFFLKISSFNHLNFAHKYLYFALIFHSCYVSSSSSFVVISYFHRCFCRLLLLLFLLFLILPVASKSEHFNYYSIVFGRKNTRFY